MVRKGAARPMTNSKVQMAETRLAKTTAQQGAGGKKCRALLTSASGQGYALTSGLTGDARARFILVAGSMKPEWRVQEQLPSLKRYSDIMKSPGEWESARGLAHSTAFVVGRHYP